MSRKKTYEMSHSRSGAVGQNEIRLPMGDRLLPSADTSESTGMRAGEVSSFLSRRRLPLIAGFLGMLGSVAVLTWALPESYHSTASFLVERREGGGLTSALEVLDRLGSGQGVETEIELLQSRRVLEPVVESQALHVEVDPAEGADLRAGRDALPGEYRVLRADGRNVVKLEDTGETIAEAPVGAELQFAGMTLVPLGTGNEAIVLKVRPFLEAVDRTQERIRATAAGPDADLVRLTCEGRNAETAQELCSAVSTGYLQLRADLQRAEANAAAEFLDGQVEQARQRLLTAEDELRAYEDANRVVALSERATEGVRQFADLRAQREQLDAERRALAEWIAAIESGEGGSNARDLASFPTFFREQNQVVTQLLASLVELENQRGAQLATRTARTPEIASIDARIAQIEAQLANLANSYEQALATQIRSLDQSLESAGNDLASIPTQQIESARLERQVSLLEELYRFLETRLHEAEVAQAVNLPSVRIVDQASLPYRAAWPNVPLNLGLGGFLGVLTGLGLALYREHTDRRLRERGEVERETGVAVLGMVPRLRRPGPVASVGQAGLIGRSLPQLGSEAEQDHHLALEAFRSILADLKFLGAERDRGVPVTVAVTSASRGEGKTFTACNLAVTQAASGGRTILIDADARASGVARFFGLPPREPGLTDILATSDLDWIQTMHDLKVADGETLHVLPAGTSTTRSAALLEGAALDLLLEQARQAADLVIIDTPPLNVLTDAAMIASRVDAVVVVVRGGSTEREALQHTLRRLANANGRVVGIVLNDATLPTHYTSYSHAV